MIWRFSYLHFCLLREPVKFAKDRSVDEKDWKRTARIAKIAELKMRPLTDITERHSPTSSSTARQLSGRPGLIKYRPLYIYYLRFVPLFLLSIGGWSCWRRFSQQLRHRQSRFASGAVPSSLEAQTGLSGSCTAPWRIIAHSLARWGKEKASPKRRRRPTLLFSALQQPLSLARPLLSCTTTAVTT